LSFNFKHIFCQGQAMGFHFRNTKCVFSVFFRNILFCITFIFCLPVLWSSLYFFQFFELTKWLSVVSLAFFLMKVYSTRYVKLYEYETGTDSQWHSFLDTFISYHHNHYICYSVHQYWQHLCVISDSVATADVAHNFDIHITTVYVYLRSHMQLCELLVNVY